MVADGTVFWLGCSRCRIDFRVRAHGQLDTSIVTCPDCGRPNRALLTPEQAAERDAHIARHEEGN